MGRIGMTEIILILAVIVLFFGINKLPEIGASIGKAIQGFKRAMKSDENENEKPADTQQK